MSQNGREKPCQRKTRIPLRVTPRPLVERRINPTAIAEDGPLHPACRKKLLFNQSYGANTSVSGTGTAPFSSTTETLLHKDDDLDSLRSYGSVCSIMSCDHAYFARNGTTFSGRRRKYVVHCPYSGDTEEYLTPTQRANRQIRGLKMLLSQVKKELQEKNQDIIRLIKEVMELRLYKAAASGPEEVPGSSEDLNRVQDADAEHYDALGEGEKIKSICASGENYIEDSQDSASRQENVQTSPALLHFGKIAVDLPSSPTDSGHFEETASASMLLTEARKDLEKKNRCIFDLKKEVMKLHLYKARLSGHEKIEGSPENVNSAQDTVEQKYSSVKDETAQAICANSESSCEDTVEQKYSSVKDETAQGICANSESSCEDSQGSAPRQENVQTSPGLLPSGKRALDLPSSLTDSGHFEETASSSFVNPKDSTSQQQTIKHHACGDVLEDRESERACIVYTWEKKLDELYRKDVNECQEHNEKMEKLLQNLSDTKERYYELHSNYEKAQDKIRELEKCTESLRKSLEEQEERHTSMYLKMYTKGQEAARFEHADQVLEFAHRAPTRVSVPELLQQLQFTENELQNIKRLLSPSSGESSMMMETKTISETCFSKFYCPKMETVSKHVLERDEQQSEYSETALLTAKEAISLWILGTRKAMYRKVVDTRTEKNEIDPVITLQFLKSAIYHFLTDKENYQGHLHAIENILGYSENERLHIQKSYRSHAKK